MKKYVTILFTLLILIGCNKIEKFSLDLSDYQKAEIVNITDKELQTKEKNKDSFAILVYTPGCISCANFESILKKYSETNNLTFYSISTEYFENTSIYKYIKHTPSLVLYKEGNIKYYLNPDKNDDSEYYKTTENFDNWFKRYILFN